MVHSFFYKHIKKKSMCRMIYKEHLLSRRKRKKTEREGKRKKGIRMGYGVRTPERERWKRKGTHTLGSHLTDGESWWDRGTTNPQRKAQQLEWGGQSRKRVRSHWYHQTQIPQPEMFRWAGWSDTGSGGQFQGED